MSVFTVFAIGTGHSRHESNTLMVRLDQSCKGVGAQHLGSAVPQMKYILDGIGKSYDADSGKVSSNIFAQATGWGLKDKAEEVIEHIQRLQPTVVNLTGHSRGAIICTRIAALLSVRMPGTRCNLFLVDPVKRSLIGSDTFNTETHHNVRLFRQIIMENESSFLFEPTKIDHGGSAARNTIHMPGRHGTATQTGQPIGVVAQMLAVNFLTLCGSDMGQAPYTAAELSDAYGRVNLSNPVKKKKSSWFGFGGGGSGRSFQDLDAGKRVFGFSGGRSLGSSFGAKNAFRDDEYFINNDHARHFQSVWPDLYMVLTGQVVPSGRLLERVLVQARSVRQRAPRAYQSLPEAFREAAA